MRAAAAMLVAKPVGLHPQRDRLKEDLARGGVAHRDLGPRIARLAARPAQMLKLALNDHDAPINVRRRDVAGPCGHRRQHAQAGQNDPRSKSGNASLLPDVKGSPPASI